jgi:hypothetical protein
MKGERDRRILIKVMQFGGSKRPLKELINNFIYDLNLRKGEVQGSKDVHF